MATQEDLKELEPTALGDSPAQAFASHKARANGIAKFFARTRPLSTVHGTADENNTIALIAHLHAASHNPDFAVPGQEASLTLAPKVLRQLNRGDGQVGTKSKYDFALKSLMTIAYRYRHLLSDDDYHFILKELVPPDFSQFNPVLIELFKAALPDPLPGVFIPESENHVLMIASSKYLVNQLLHDDHPGESKYDNSAIEDGWNGLSAWLLGYMQKIAKHDFLEFSARPYARMSLHALYNLHEFAHDEPIRTAAQTLLDYTLVKFALSSNRGRRVNPFRRHQQQINHQANELNDLYAEEGDQVVGHFMAYTGHTDPKGNPASFPESLALTALIAATAAYRPPPAAYMLAMKHDYPPCLHRFYHGTRPLLPSRLPGTPDIPEGGLEIYYRSPSFLLSAGGMFLNSGYGYDEVTIGEHHRWEETSRAQATTLIPTRADTKFFHDLIRFEPYPDPLAPPFVADPDHGDHFHTRSVNIGVHRGLAAGANLRPAEKKTVWEHATESSPVLALHADRLLISWRGVGNDKMNVATVQETSPLGIDGMSLLGIDGVEGVVEKFTLVGDTTDSSPALASHNGRLFLAWKGSGNNQLNLAFSDDNGASFKGKTSPPGASSKYSPSLTSHADKLFLAWTGESNEKLNVAQVILLGNTAGVFSFELESHVPLGDSSEAAPALTSDNQLLFLAWKGSGNNQLNLAFSDDNGASFKGKTSPPGVSSKYSPSLTSHADKLFLAWTGESNEKLNVAQVILLGNTAGVFSFELEGKVTLDETSTEAPALGSHNERLFLAWKGEGNNLLNLRVCRDGTFQTPGPWFFREQFGFFLAAYRTPPARPDELDTVLDSLALVYAMEAGSEPSSMDFNRFRELTLARNSGLPAKLDYGSFYEFHAPDDKRFSVWFQLEGQKYQARIADPNDPNEVGDLSTLPLVSGEYMNALKKPSGHDGLIEIRYSGCDTALTLDYHDAAHPVRIDNATACPQPLIDRAQAIMDYARDRISKAQAPLDPADPVDPLDALRTAVEVFRDFDPPKAILSEYLLAYGQAVYALLAFLLGIGRLDEVLSLVREGVSVELAVANAPGADVMRVARDLAALATLLASASRPDEAVLAQQALVDVLVGFTPPAEQRLEYLIDLAEGRHNLIARLLDDRQVEQGAGLTTQALSSYRDYVGQPGADVMRVARDLAALATLLSAAGRPHEAVLAQQALVDVLVGFTPPAEGRLEYLIDLAEGRHNLIARLIEDSRPNEATPLVAQALSAYQTYAVLSGADVLRVGRDLANLDSILEAARRTPQAVDVLQALVAILDAFTPTDTDRPTYQIDVAEARHTLIVRLFEDSRPDEAVLLVAPTVAAYQTYVALPGADVLRVGRDLANLDSILEAARHTPQAVDVLQALVAILLAFTPTDTDRLTYQIALAEARHTLIARLLEDSRPDEAVPLVAQTLSAYRTYVALPGADVLRVGRDLAALDSILEAARHTTSAVDVLQALVAILDAFTPTDTDRLTYQIALAEARHNLIARLFEDSRPDEAVLLVASTIAAYQTYAALPGADVLRVGRDLANLDSILEAARRTPQAADVRRALDQIGGA